MKTLEKSAKVKRVTDAQVNGNLVGANLPAPEVEQTNPSGKVAEKFTLNELANAEANAEALKKNEVFTEVNEYFCPCHFDTSELEKSLQPLVVAGILSPDAKVAAIEKSKREFLEAHKEEINAAENLTFADVVAKLQANENLYKKVLNVCNISELKESDYIKEGKVQIFRSAQNQDKDGKDKYVDVTLKTTFNGKEFSQNLFVEYREVSTSNIILSIRYNQSRLDAQKRLLNQVTDYKRILSNVYETAKRAAENGFTYEQISKVIADVFADAK